MNKNEEERSLDARFKVDKESRTIEGYAIVFNSLSEDLGGWRERISEHAADGVIERSDVIATVNHMGYKVPLARSTKGKGTLSLKIDEVGVRYKFEAPKTAAGDEVLEAIARQDMRSNSFVFTVAENGVKWDEEDDIYVRNVLKFDQIYDISIVTRPAYSEANIDVAKRSLDNLKKEKSDYADLMEKMSNFEIK